MSLFISFNRYILKYDLVRLVLVAIFFYLRAMLDLTYELIGLDLSLFM